MIVPHDATRGAPPHEYLHWGTDYCHAPVSLPSQKKKKKKRNPPNTHTHSSKQKGLMKETLQEQQVLNANGTHDLSEKTNVWQVGITMWALLHSDWSAGPNAMSQGPYHPPGGPLLHPRARNPMTATFPLEIQTHYSIHLISTIYRCLRHDHTQRYTFDDILTRCRNSQIALPQQYRLRQSPRDDARFLNNDNAIKLDEDRWPLGAPLTRHWYRLNDQAEPPVPARGAGGDVRGMGILPPHGTAVLG